MVAIEDQGRLTSSVIGAALVSVDWSAVVEVQRKSSPPVESRFDSVDLIVASNACEGTAIDLSSFLLGDFFRGQLVGPVERGRTFDLGLTLTIVSANQRDLTFITRRSSGKRLIVALDRR